MSMSVRVPAEISLSDKTESALAFPFCIKNTFIDVLDDLELQMPRRSASAPATPRAYDNNLSSCSAHDWQHVASPSLKSDVSTTTEADDQSELSDDSCGESESSDSKSVEITLVDLLPPPKAPSRTTLNIGAKAFAPSYRRSALHMSSDVRSLFAGIMAAARAALMSVAGIEQVTSNQVDDNWILEASCHQASLHRIHSALPVAKHAMLCAAERSSKIRILGHERTPFAPISAGFGFSAKFAFVEDDATVCWSLMAKGGCRRGCSCRWHHPTWIMSMSVIVKV